MEVAVSVRYLLMNSSLPRSKAGAHGASKSKCVSQMNMNRNFLLQMAKQTIRLGFPFHRTIRFIDIPSRRRFDVASPHLHLFFDLHKPLSIDNLGTFICGAPGYIFVYKYLYIYINICTCIYMHFF
jgi:hypothetical protein